MIAGLLVLWASSTILLRTSFSPMAAAQDRLAAVPLNDEQVQALVQRVLDNQRRDDHAIWEYDRTERWFTRGNGKDVPDREVLNRIIPTGSSQARVELEHDGKPVDPMDLERSWAHVEQELMNASHPDPKHSKADADRAAKRKQDTDEAVESINRAFRFHFVKSTNEDGHTIVELSFEPNPKFRSSSRIAMVFAHTRGTVWVDQPNAQLVRLAAELSEDVTYAAGLIAKIYRGGRLNFEQEEVSPGIWLPTHTSYDIEGRKFVFGTVSIHERIDASGYRRLGPPEQALALVRREHPTASVNDP